MPEGALLTHTVEAVLQDLAASGATGCLLVRDQEGDEAEVFLRDGEVYAVSVPGRRVMLGVRLMSRGALTPEALAEALEIQRTELQGWRLGELLVHLGYVELSVVEEFVVEHLKDALADLLGWPVAAWKFRKNKKTRQDVAPPTPVSALFDELRHRATTWETILAATGGPGRGADPGRGLAVGRRRPRPERVGPALQDRRPPGRWPTWPASAGSPCSRPARSSCGWSRPDWWACPAYPMYPGCPGYPRTSRCRLPRPRSTRSEVDEVEAVVEELAVEVEDGEPAELSEVQLETVDEAGVELVLPVVDLAEMEVREAAEAAEREAAEAADAAEREQADRAARERTEAEEREAHRTAAESKRLREAEILHRELEALAAKEAAARAERAEARKRARAEMQAEQAATEAHTAADASAGRRGPGAAAAGGHPARPGCRRGAGVGRARQPPGRRARRSGGAGLGRARRLARR